MLANSPRASCSPRQARFSAHPRSPRSPRFPSGLSKPCSSSTTSEKTLTRAEQLAQWKLRRAAAAIAESSKHKKQTKHSKIKNRNGLTKRTSRTAAARNNLVKGNCNAQKRIKNSQSQVPTKSQPLMIDLRGLKSSTSSSSVSFARESHDSQRTVASPALKAMKKRLQGSAKKQSKRLHSGVSSQTMLFKQRLSAKKAKRVKQPKKEVSKTHLPKKSIGHKRKSVSKKSEREYSLSHKHTAVVNKPLSNTSKRRRVTAKQNMHLAHSSGVSRATQAIESSIPAKRKLERQNRVRILALGDMGIVQEHIKWGRHEQAAAVLHGMSPETEKVAKTLSQYWVQQILLEERCGNHLHIKTLFDLADRHVKDSSQKAEIENEKERYQNRTARWKAVASTQKEKEISHVREKDIESVLDSSICGDPDSVEDDTAKRLSFTCVQVSPQGTSLPLSSSSSHVHQRDTDDNDDDISFVFNGGNDSLDLNDENDDNTDVLPDLSPNLSTHHSQKASSHRKSYGSAGKKIIRVAKCGGLVLVDPPNTPNMHNGESPNIQSPVRPSSIVRMAAVRVASGSKQRKLGSSRALTPVRRSTRLVKSDQPVQSTTEMLMENGYSYMPNPSLRGAHFAPSMPALDSEDDEDQDEVPFDSDSDIAGENTQFLDNTGVCQNTMANANANANETRQKYTESNEIIISNGQSPRVDMALSVETSREPTPMLPRNFVGSAMPPPPPRATNQVKYGSEILGSAYVLNGVTPVRRSARIQELTPTPLRKEMEDMLGFSS